MEFSWKDAYFNAVLAHISYAGQDYEDWLDPDLRLKMLRDYGVSDRTINWFEETYEFIDASLDNWITGYDGILLRKREMNDDGTVDYYLLNRGTELDPSQTIDVADIVADIIAVTEGISFGQLDQLTEFYQHNEGLLSAPNARLTLVGHSLGGHLSTLFAVKNPDLVDNVWNYNPLGVPAEVVTWDSLSDAQRAALSETTGQVLDTAEKIAARSERFAKHLVPIVSSLYDSIPGDVPAPDGVNIWNLVLEDGADLVHEIFARHGISTYVEGGEVGSGADPRAVHSIEKLTDVILMTYLMTSIDSSLSERSIGQLIRAMSVNSYLDHDELVEAAAGFFQLPFAATDNPDVTNRELDGTYDAKYHSAFEQTALDVIALVEAQGGTTLSNLLELSDDYLLEKVQQDGAFGAAFRYAVLNELPFTLPALTSFTDSLQGLSQYWENQLSSTEWTQRITSLRVLLEIRITGADTAPAEAALNYLNLDTDTEFTSAGTPGLPTPETVDVFFGTQADEVLAATVHSEVDAHLFAGDGHDTLRGANGNDHLEGGYGNDLIDGGSGNDRLLGNAGDDRLTGGTGNDVLQGGEGADVYVFASGDGRDVVDDASASARIQIDGVTLGSIQQLDAGIPIYTDGIHRYQQVGNDLVILVNGAMQPDLEQSIRLVGWDAEVHSYGLQVVAAAVETAPQPQGDELQVRSGDEAYVSPDGSQSASDIHSHQVHREEWVNGVSLHYEADAYAAYNPETFSFSQPFVFEGSHVNDYLYAGAHRDHLYGGNGDDLLQFYNGDNVGEGGRGSDYLVGGSGADTLWGDSSGYHIRGDAAVIEEQDGDSDHIKGGAGDDWISGGSWRDRLFGEDGADFIDGGAGADWISGGDGNDQLLGDSRVALRDGEQVLYRFHRYASTADTRFFYNDWLDGGAGNDLLLGELGDDVIRGGSGDDLLMGDRLNDPSLYAQDPNNPEDDYIELAAGLHGNDDLDGGEGADQLFGNAGNDVLNGGSGADYLHGDDDWLAVWQHGDDRLSGGADDDQLLGGGGRDQLSGDEGNDVLIGGAGDDELRGGIGNDYLHGDDSGLATALHGNDSLFGGEGADQLQGGAGDDRLYGGAGADTLFGEDGNDELYGNDDADDLVGGAGHDYLSGGAGDDRLWGGAGVDVLHGGSGHDILQGEDGDDVYLYAAGDGLVEVHDESGLQRIELRGAISAADVRFSQKDGVTELQFADAEDVLRMPNQTWSRVSGIYLQDGTDVLPILNSEDATQNLFGSAGSDFLSVTEAMVARGNAGDDLITGGASVQYLSGGSGNDLLFGFAGADTLLGGSGDDLLEGGEGDDDLDGGAGNDRITGGEGNDTYQGGAGDDWYYYAYGDGYDQLLAAGRDGFDVLEFASGLTPADVEVRKFDDALRVMIRNEYAGVWSTASEASGVLEEIRFADDPDTVWSAADFTDLYQQGTEWNDSIWVVAGLDPVLYGLGGNDQLIGRAQDDELHGGAGDDSLSGFDGADVLMGGDGADRLYGGNGDDVLTGGSGSDRLYGQAGNDLFVFAAGFGRDEVWLDADYTGVDVFRFETGMNASDAVISGLGNGDLTISFAGMDDVLTLRRFLTAAGDYAADQFLFADGVEWDAQALFTQHLAGTEGDDYIFGSEAAEVVTGRAGDDVLRGGRGDDTLRGGAGDDLLLGQAGADIYEFGRGDGHDLVNLQDHDSTLELDQVLFLPGISPDDVHARNTDGSGLRLRILGSDDYIDVANYFSSYVQNLIEVRFSDAPSTVWTFTEIDAMRWQATDYDDEIFGRYGDESLFGGAGNDTLWGNDGNDTLDGGADDDLLIGGRGNDQLTGGTGSDVYLYEAGHGNDVIHNLDESALRMDVLRLGATIEAAELRAYRWFDDLLLEHGASMSTITVQDWFLGEAYALDQVEFADGMVWTASVLNGFAATASPYSDHLSGTSADDTLRGLAGDDVLQGAAGNDFLAGDAGADTYFYRAGDGTDVIDNFDGSAAETETVLLGDAIAPEQVNARRSGDDLLLYLSMEGSLRILGHFADAARAITQVQFADGSTWNAEELAARVRIATSGDDELVGDDGYQYLVGGDGNDLLDGRGGNDVLQGDAGNDTYRFGFGYAADQVYNQDKTSGRYDRIEMTAGVQAADVTVQRDADHLYLLLRDTGDSIRVNNHFVAKGKYAGSHIDAVAFADGTQWSRADIASFTELSALGSYVLHGDAQANVLTGFGGDDQLLGHDGDDALHGGAGNDMLRGGLGADWLSGGKGNDVYRFDAGDGADVIENQDLSAGRHDVLEFGAGVTSGQVGVLRLQDDLWLNVGNGDSVLVRNFYQPGGALDSVRFADGSAWSQADLAARATVNVAPDVQGEAYVMQEDGVLTLQVTDLLQNDNDANGDALAVTGVSHALHGSVSYSRDAGTIRFEPDADYFGPAGFRYTVSDGYESVQGEVSVSVNDVPEPANSTPEAVDDAFALRVGETLVISAATLLANDSDADGDLLELLAVRNALHAGVVFDAQRGEITVVPDEHFVGEASFEYQVSDGASTALGTVRLVVSPESGAQLGTSGDDAMRGGSKADALYGLDGNDVLEGGRGADTLHGGAGNDLLRGGAGDDHYVVKAGEGADVIENAGRKSEYDVLWLTGQTDETRVWLSRSDADLEVTLLGAGGSVTVRDWYADRTGQLHEIHAGGRTLLNDQVESLADAMSAYVMPTGPDAQIPDALRSTVDAAWQ